MKLSSFSPTQPEGRIHQDLTQIPYYEVSNLSGLHQCTMQLSIELDTSKVFKSNGLFFAQFGSKFENFNSEW